MRAEEFIHSANDRDRNRDLKDVSEWLDTTVDNLWVEVKYEPISMFLTQIKEMYGTYDEFPKDAARTNKIVKLIKQGKFFGPIYVDKHDPHRFVMEGRHRMVAYWLANRPGIPVAYVSRID